MYRMEGREDKTLPTFIEEPSRLRPLEDGLVCIAAAKRKKTFPHYRTNEKEAEWKGDKARYRPRRRQYR